MASTAPAKLDVLQPAMPDILVALERIGSGDHYQQMLSTDAALQALEISKNSLMHKIRALGIPERFKRSKIQSLKAGVAAEYEAIQQALADLNTLLRSFEKLQKAARHRHEQRALAWPFREVRKGWKGLPDELLIMIFKNLEDHPRSIKNARLTCHRFKQITSPLLLRHVEVSPSAASLQHLEEVMSNREISQGIRSFKINLRYYSAAWAANLQDFSTMCHGKLKRKIESFKDLLEQDDSDDSDESECKEEEEDGGKIRLFEDFLLKAKVPRKTCTDSVTQAQRILSTWRPFTNGSTIEDFSHLDAAALALQGGFERYRELFQQQEMMLRDGYFARTVGAAAAKSQSTISLSMSDAGRHWHWRDWHPWANRVPAKSDLDYWHPWANRVPAKSDLDLFANPDLLVQSALVQPQTWSLLLNDCDWTEEPERLMDDESRDIPQSLLYEMPLAMRAAGVHLNEISVQVQPPCQLSLNMSHDQLSGLSDIANELQSFTFCFQGWDNSLERMRGLDAYLRAAIGPHGVPTLSLIGRFPIGPMLRSQNWHRLKFISLDDFHVDLEELRQLMSMLESGTRINLVRIYLKGGTWAAALDCLRTKAGSGSPLHNLKGAELGFDTMKGDLDFRALLYITCVEGIKNPLREDRAPDSEDGRGDSIVYDSEDYGEDDIVDDSEDDISDGREDDSEDDASEMSFDS